jgi:ribonuclease BN (tRNA processing enzyme)
VAGDGSVPVGPAASGPPAGGRGTLDSIGNGVRLRVLGCSGGYPGPGNPCSGYLLEAAGQRVWVDAGGGTLAELQRHCSLADLDAVWISHLHPDHCTDLPLAYHVLAVGGVRGGRRLPVLGPSGWSRHMDAFVDTPGGMATVFDVVELSDGERVSFAELAMVAMATVHGIETYGFRATVDGSTLAYSADSGPCEALRGLAESSDLFLCEAFLSPGGPVEPHDGAISLTPEQAGWFAEAGGARRLVLTHLPPGADPARARSLAAASFGGEVELASMGRTFELPGSAMAQRDPRHR